MHADHVEFSWDASKSSWLLRIEAGEEGHTATLYFADEMVQMRRFGQFIHDQQSWFM